jgi:hypothetical protein
MIRTLSLALVAMLAISSSADARQRRHHSSHKTPHHRSITDVNRATDNFSSAQCGFFCGFEQSASIAPTKATRRAERRASRRSARRERSSESRSVSASGIVGPLAAKVSQIKSACGSTVISGVRHTRVAGSGRMSLHASGKAVDMRGNPSCIYGQLAGWSGGYSTDYGRMQHIHISYDASGGREMGLRFAHGGGRHHSRHRYARRHRHSRYANR